MGKTSSKSIQSFHNIILLFLFIIGLYILYKYIKNVEKETKLLHNHIIELTDKLNFFTKQESCPVVVEEKNKLEDIEPTTVTPDDDRESIQSEDIVNMLRKVMVVDEDEEEEEDNVKIAVVEDTEEVVDSIKEDLVKKTNEELRNVLRDKKLSTKGSKQELVDRIMENA